MRPPYLGCRERTPTYVLSYMDINFWIGAVAIPAVLLIGNSIVRRAGFGMAQSACADVALMFTAFDAAVLLQLDDFRKRIPFHDFAVNISGIFTLNLIVCIFFWFLLVRAERALDEHHRGTTTGYPYLAVGTSLLLPAIMAFSNFAPFVYRG